jgi:hypothetical protein
MNAANLSDPSVTPHEHGDIDMTHKTATVLIASPASP